MSRFQIGFSLVEIMLSLTLGLIISAAALVLLFAVQRSFTLQQSTADIQENAHFSLNFITKDLRLANLQAPSTIMTNDSLHGGIVLSTANLSSTDQTETRYLSQSTVAASSNVNVGSDQLVIQYRPVKSGGYDCEGREITSTSDYVIQRYFIRKDSNYDASDTASTALALACDAGRNTGTTTSNFGDSGQIVMKRVDYFHVLLTVQNSVGQFRDMTISEYQQSARDGRILGVKIGILTRVNVADKRQNEGAAVATFQILDQSITLNRALTERKNQFKHQVIIQSIAMRNALGEV
ncbi:MAG: prepilin-type cleavage/methylation domain-containing protein [Acinetobacter sp.]